MTTYLHTIRAVRLIRDAQLEIVFEDGRPRTVDLSSLIRGGGVFATLRDPGAFGQVRRDARGRALVWPNGVDLCADALWLAAEHGGAMPSPIAMTKSVRDP
jgi:hypothetical protein